MKPRWIVIQRNSELYRDDGIRFIAFPLGNDEKQAQMLIDSLGIRKDELSWIVEEIGNESKS